MAKSLYDKVKEGIAKSSRGYGRFLRVPDGSKVKIRFLTDFEDGVEIREHSKWGEVNPVPCVAYHFGKECKWCKDKSSEMRLKSVFCWTVFDLNSKEKKIFKFAVSKASPVKSLADAYSQYKTLMDRDYVISRSGSRFDTTYSLIPLDKSKFKFEGRTKPYSKDKIVQEDVETSGEITMEDIEELDDADFDDIKDADDDNFQDDDFEDDDKKSKGKKKSKKAEVEEDDIDDDEDDDEDEKPKAKKKSKKTEDEDDDLDGEDDDVDFDDDEDEEEKPKKKEDLKKKIKK